MTNENRITKGKATVLFVNAKEELEFEFDELIPSETKMCLRVGEFNKPKSLTYIVYANVQYMEIVRY